MKSRKAKKRKTRIYQQRMSPNEKKSMRLAELLMKNGQNQRVTYTDFSDLIK